MKDDHDTYSLPEQAKKRIIGALVFDRRGRPWIVEDAYLLAGSIDWSYIQCVLKGAGDETKTADIANLFPTRLQPRVGHTFYADQVCQARFKLNPSIITTDKLVVNNRKGYLGIELVGSQGQRMYLEHTRAYTLLRDSRMPPVERWGFEPWEYINGKTTLHYEYETEPRALD